jgi:HSP20 family protein
MAGRRRHIGDLPGEIQDLFAELWHVPRYAGQRRGFRPQCDCFRTEDPPTLHVVVELPGVDPSSVQLVAAGSSLVVSGTRERPQATGARYHQMEIEYGAFHRRIDLAERIDTTRASASYDGGMLRVELPLAAASQRGEPVPIDVRRR